MKTKRIDDTLVAWMPVPTHDRGSRRMAERHAVAQLMRMLGHDPDKLTHTADGAPQMPGCHISVSHSRRLAVVAISTTQPVGIDAEEQRPTLQRVRHKFVNADEEAWITDTDLLQLWTVKEAVYKLAGVRGLAFTDIVTACDWTLASALGRQYKLTFLPLGDTMVCLSTMH